MTDFYKVTRVAAALGFCISSVSAFAGPADAHKMDMAHAKTVMCRGPLMLHHEAAEGYNLLVIESTQPFAASGERGELLKPGQCGNVSKSFTNTKFRRWSPKSFEQIMHRSEQSFQFTLNCLMSENYIYVFKEQYLTGRSHCIPFKKPAREVMRKR